MQICPSCGAVYPAHEPRWRCDCGHHLDLSWPALFDRSSIKADDFSLWRYRHVLPLAAEIRPVTLGEGLTPLVPAGWRGREVLFKLDYLCPSGSFKDRGTTLLVSQLKAWGIDDVVEDSSGNAGSSLAAYAARAHIGCTIYVPAGSSPGKLVQMALSGAHIVTVEQGRDSTAAAALKAAETKFYASHNLSPYFIAGVATLAYELAEQLHWTAPDTVIVPVGNGSLVLGLAAGFELLKESGVIAALPRLIGVQTASTAPLARAFADGAAVPSPARWQASLAEGIACPDPPRGQEILAAIRKSGGLLMTVDEEEIAIAAVELARTGLYAEPTSATVAAALTRLHGAGGEDLGRTVAVLTGSGLKATETLQKLYDGHRRE